jgi:hypothetical protein
MQEVSDPFIASFRDMMVLIAPGHAIVQNIFAFFLFSSHLSRKLGRDQASLPAQASKLNYLGICEPVFCSTLADADIKLIGSSMPSLPVC